MVENFHINLQFVFIYNYSLLNNVNLILISIYHVLTKDNYFNKNVKSLYNLKEYTRLRINENKLHYFGNLDKFLSLSIIKNDDDNKKSRNFATFRLYKRLKGIFIIK